MSSVFGVNSKDFIKRRALPLVTLLSGLIALILQGKKKATAGTLEWDYRANGEPIEFVGEKLAVLNNDGEQVATIQATRVEVVRFADVPDEFALAEGEGDLSGDDFRAGHLRYWSREGLTINDDTEIVLLYFDLISPMNKESGL
ncbi:MAG: ASCH domain-containing protein [Burkholderiaceae bacterium]|nr:ASCH domain-containing protein [Burkholderiaceae bacterium]